MSGLNMGIIKGLPVRLPPIDVQAAFVARSASVTGLRDREYEHLKHLDALFASLQARAFSGELYR